jgi:hypothetical protein
MSDPTTPAIRADAVPATLHSQNSIETFSIGLYHWDVYHILWNEEDGPQTQVEIEINTSPPEVHYTLQPTTPGANYTFSVQGCSRGLFGSICSDWSDPITVVAAQNNSQMRMFLSRSGIDLSRDVRLRQLEPGKPLISLRSLLQGL